MNICKKALYIINKIITSNNNKLIIFCLNIILIYINTLIALIIISLQINIKFYNIIIQFVILQFVYDFLFINDFYFPKLILKFHRIVNNIIALFFLYSLIL